MRKTLRRTVNRWLRRSETGQSIIVLALALVALLSFVGITTDVSLMFVRYSQLSRAVDSAAIAAANQIREDRNHANVSIAARQFIEFHGLDPITVLVDTCNSLPIDQRPDDEICTDDQAKFVRVTAQINSPTVFLSLLNIPDFPLEASAVSQTAALDVVLIMDVSETMLDDTSLEDWIDIEHRIASNDAGYTADSRDIAVRDTLGTVYVPPVMDQTFFDNVVALDPPNCASMDGDADFATMVVDGSATEADLVQVWDAFLTCGQNWMNDQLVYVDLNDPTAVANTEDNPFRVLYDSEYLAASQDQPRDDCRVRFVPYTSLGTRFYVGEVDADGDPVPLAGVSGSLLGDVTGDGSWDGRILWDGFAPTYNFYGCCNDPDGDGTFEDLVCQPFKQARDATFQFLERIDFFRGDRVAFVNYATRAFLVNPYGTTSDGGETVRKGAMIDDVNDAYSTLRDLVGVRAEPTSYIYNIGSYDSDQYADRFTDTGWAYWAQQGVYSGGFDENGEQIYLKYGADLDGFEDLNESDGDLSTDDGQVYNNEAALINYPVYDECYMRSTFEGDPRRTRFHNVIRKITLPHNYPRVDLRTGGPPTDEFGNPQTSGTPNLAWSSFNYNFQKANTVYTMSMASSANDQSTFNIQTSYDLRSACRDGNIGAALREASNALLNPRTVRRFGTIWVMVLLGSGASGASDPIRRNEYVGNDLVKRGVKLSPSDPYECAVQNPTDPSICDSYGLVGDYGAYGVCPFGRPSVDEIGELIDQRGDWPGTTDPTRSRVVQQFPFCSDEEPRSRHFCDFRPFRLLDPTNDAQAMNDYDYIPFISEEEGSKNGFVVQRVGGLLYYNYPPGHDRNSAQIAPNGWYLGPQEAAQEQEWNRVNNNIYDVAYDAESPSIYTGGRGCRYYDVDDYARDWADYVALDIAGDGATQLPTIFTIGFGLNFDNDTLNLETTTLTVDKDSNDREDIQQTCAANVADCLGEQLLRYIADVGDNNRIDNDYYQDVMENVYGVLPGSMPNELDPDGLLENGLFGPRDPCQTQDEGHGNESYRDEDGDAGGVAYSPDEEDLQYGQLRSGLDCGNYYAAPSPSRLQFVFDDIASRMFTRLSR